MTITKNYIEELKWRGMLQDMMPGTEELLNKGMVSGYIGFDPTADSLGVGNLVQIMSLLHFQRCGHKPIALVGGATGMVGDPSGKSDERNLLDEKTLNHNLNCQRAQLEKFLDFNCGENSASIVNNYDWFKNFTFLDFIRDVGKHLSINYMMAKDSVKSRLETGMSFTEFSYQLVQGYDFYYLWKNNGVMLQMGGSDQWGNIVTGTELIRRKDGGEAFALTTPLIKKADGTKFGKSEKGNVWLDPKRTSPYLFYQFWLNAADADVANYIRIFSIKAKEEIEDLEAVHNAAPHLRLLQKTLADEITTRVHSNDDLMQAKLASEALFGNTIDGLLALKQNTFAEVADSIAQFEIDKNILMNGIGVMDFLATHTTVSKSKSDARRAIEQGGISINKEKVTDMNMVVNTSHIIKENYILVQSGKKNYYSIKIK
jgi:tyrosyl-tRNA synthetase